MDEKKWKRKLPCRIYDYNYKVGESYYTPQTEYIESRDSLSKKVIPPDCASYAERFANKPFYGSAYGLPYLDDDSALSQPLVHRRSASANRGDSRERDDLPSSSRLGRGRERAPRDRRLSFNLGDDEQDKPRRKFSLVDDLDFKVPVSRYVDSDYGFRSSLDRDNLVDQDSFGIPSAMKESIQSDIQKLEKQFKKADTLERGTGGPRSKQWHEVAYNQPGDQPTRKSSVKRDNVSYRDPTTGASVRKTSYQETTRLESSKPPRAPPKPSRLLSIEDSDFKALPRPTRRRHLSLSDPDDNFDFKLSSRSFRSGGDDTVERKYSSSKKVFDHRRAAESEELSSKVNKMINKMRKHSLSGDEPSFSSRFGRASSLDPDSSSRRLSRSSLYSYGYSK